MLARTLRRITALGQFATTPKPTPPADIVDNPLINQPPNRVTSIRTKMMHNGWRVPDDTYQRSKSTHLSNAEQLIHKIPVIKVHTNVVRCIGGTQSGAGHPVEFIQVNTRHLGEAIACKYCGLRYALAAHDEHHDQTHPAQDNAGHHQAHHQATSGDDGYDQSHLKKHHKEVLNQKFLQ